MISIADIYPDRKNESFVIGEDNFEDVKIHSTQINNLWYFKNETKGLVKQFVIGRTRETERVCKITLIRKEDGRFTPRFDFEIWNKSKRACDSFEKTKIDENLIKARVGLGNCYENFSTLIGFIQSVSSIDFNSSSYAVIPDKKDIFEEVSKDNAVKMFAERYSEEISEEDLSVLQGRKKALDKFDKLLTDPSYFESARVELQIETTSKTKRNEDIWQSFFEKNQWIFGYGLQLLACEGLDDRTLEQRVVGNDVFDGSGKRIDALLKTKGNISKILFCEIKQHSPGLLMKPYDRPGVFVPGKELQGAVAQVQKTIHKAQMKVKDNFLRVVSEDGEPTGEELLYVRPRGVVVIGMLDDFVGPNGVNYEKLSSFELYRQQISGIEIITYDELFERVRFIVENG